MFIGSMLQMFNGYSDKEKSILISLLAVVVLYGSYFADVLLGASGRTLDETLTSMGGILVALIIVHVVFHIVISLDDVSESEDERDRLISRRASVFGYNVLFVGVLVVVSRVLVASAFLGEVPTPAETVNLLIGALVLSEAVYYLMQLVFYRRGVSV